MFRILGQTAPGQEENEMKIIRYRTNGRIDYGVGTLQNPMEEED